MEVRSSGAERMAAHGGTMTRPAAVLSSISGCASPQVAYLDPNASSLSGTLSLAAPDRLFSVWRESHHERCGGRTCEVHKRLWPCFYESSQLGAPELEGAGRA